MIITLRRSARTGRGYLLKDCHSRDRLPEDQLTDIAIGLSWGGKLDVSSTNCARFLKKHPATRRQGLTWPKSCSGPGSRMRLCRRSIPSFPPSRMTVMASW